MCFPLNFLLGVVLTDGDDVVLTKGDWEDIVEYFAYREKDADGKGEPLAPGKALAVDYMLFSTAVLDSSQLEVRPPISLNNY